jgi:hypothetical protein
MGTWEKVEKALRFKSAFRRNSARAQQVPFTEMKKTIIRQAMKKGSLD